MLTASVDDARGQRHVAPRAQGSNRTMEAETYTMGAEGFVPLWDVNTFGAPTPPQPLVNDSVVNVVGAAFMIGLFDPLKPLRPVAGVDGHGCVCACRQQEPSSDRLKTARCRKSCAHRPLERTFENAPPRLLIALQLAFVSFELLPYAIVNVKSKCENTILRERPPGHI